MANELFKNYGFELEDNRVPVAVVLPAEQEAVVGSIVKLDGRSSTDPEGKGLTYFWEFAQVPIGSQVAKFGFNHLEDDGAITTFAPDIPGPYKVQLQVSDGSLTSDPAEAVIDVRVILVPNHKGIIPDASFIWNYLSDFWEIVDGRKQFETFWSTAIQIVASEILKLYQYDYNKSIRDIQELFQKRWLSYSPALLLNRDEVKFILADDQAGEEGSTMLIDPVTGLPESNQPDYTNLLSIPSSGGSFEVTSFGSAISRGRILQLGDRGYTLARANPVDQSQNSGEDGNVTAGADEFVGSMFAESMVGYTLRILGNVVGVSGDWVIASVVDQTTITVEDGSGTAASWGTSASGLKYSVLSPVPSHSGFFADVEQIPGGLDKQSWRFSSTLISNTIDFEQEGVSSGDVLEIEISRTDLGLSSTFYAQVVSVDRSRLGFALNLEDLVPGVPASWLTEDIQVTLAADLQVPGLSSGPYGALLYSDQSWDVRETVRSKKFKRSYFERELTPESLIDVGPFSITARPVKVIRNSRIPVDSTLISAPVLQEYVKQPIVTKEGDSLLLHTEGGTKRTSREPYILIENLDYVLDDESMISGVCDVTLGSDEVSIPYGDLLDRSIKEGDTLYLLLGVTEQKFDVRRVLSADKLRVHPPLGETSSGARFRIERRQSGKYLRFIKGTFTKTRPAPTRLWSEVCYFDNSKAVEDNFGVLVGVTREVLEEANSQVPYKSAVAGLMYALTNGPTVENLALSAQILLGLPFTQNAGVITEINSDYRKRDDGSPLYGRILVEARNEKNQPLGLTNIYLYPHGRQIIDATTGEWVPALADFSGIATNPKTGQPFKVGDSVDQFVRLSNGVEIQEYLSTPDWLERLKAQGDFSAQLRQYHSFQLLVNADLVTSADIDIVARFMRKAKAHYNRFTSAILRGIDDFVDVEDTLVFGRPVKFFDHTGLGITSAVKFDGGDENGTVFSFEGKAYTRYLYGEDLTTDQSSTSALPGGGMTTRVTSAAAGFLDARVSEVESFDSPRLRVGDLLVIHEGHNQGHYLVSEVVSDSALDVRSTEQENVESLEDQPFSVYRPLGNPIWRGKVNVTTGDGIVATQEVIGTQGGIGSAGVSVGDLIVFADLSIANPIASRSYRVLEVVPSSTNPYVVISPDPIEDTGQYDAWVVREGLMTRGSLKEPLQEDAKFYVRHSVGIPILTFEDGPDPTSWLNVSLIRPGSVITADGVEYLVLERVLGTNGFVVTPSPDSAASGVPATVDLYPNRPSAVISTDFLDRIPSDYLELSLLLSEASGDSVTTSIGSTDVQSSLGTNFDIDLGARPGDYLILLEGDDSIRDLGHGPGVFLIRSVLMAGATLRLSEELTATGSFRYGIRRKKPNEG